MKKRMIHCFNCGEELGEYDARFCYAGDLEACASRECQSAMNEELRSRDAEARENAAEDNYDRYR